MPTAKLGQFSSLDVNQIQNDHFDVDMQIRDVLTVLSLVQKKSLLSKLPSIITGLDSGEVDINTGE